MSSFALIGAAGYVAPRHMRAIKDTENELVAALDPNDSVGVIDSFFPSAHFFTEFERFDRHIDKLRRHKNSKSIDYFTICSPNYLHDSHVRFALRSGADAICEKPLVLNPWNIDGLKEIESDTGKRIHTILQLRLHPSIIRLKQDVALAKADKKHDVELTYITSRGRWYMNSWKGDVRKSGGIATNIGVHFFDMLHYIFGSVQKSTVHSCSESTSSGLIEYENARVRWFLSIDSAYIPDEILAKGQRTYRSITVDTKEVEFSDGFTDLHTQSYQKILDNKGFGLEDNRTAIETVADIRNASPVGLQGDYHPFLKISPS
ncbi:oxidoreductase [Gammaproteobacteria bacterium 45_16_T64]|nr:oxidoreductase [Gammaproteobacteria bacterium 45_16_T64]